MKRAFVILSPFALIAFFFVFSLEKSFQISPAQVSRLEDLSKEQNSAQKANIILVGDIMLDRGVEYKIKKEGNNDFKFPFLKIADYLKSKDLVFGNLEGPISDKGIKVGSIYSFRMDPAAIEGLSFAGFDVFSFANNHVFDYSQKAFEDTLSRLKTAGIDYAGAGFNESEAHEPVIKNIKGMKIAFLAYANVGSKSWDAGPNSSGIAWIDGQDFENVKKDIANAKKESDILIVSVHAGDEYTQNLTEFQKEFSRAAIDAGADLVVGHHPHVAQKSEQYNGKWIFYSLGNFIFDQDFSVETMRGQIIEIVIQDKKIEEVMPRQIQLNKFFQPELVAD